MQYIVQIGDTLSSIARRFNTTVQAILALNPQITDPNFLRVGQIIIIPIGPIPPPPPPPGVCPRLSRGSTGPAVRDLQTRLRARGFDPGAIDGIFGPRTEAAVIAFQRSVGLFPSGIVDVPTWTALGVNCGVVPPPPPPPPPPPGVCPRLSRGSTGPFVRDLQTRLRARGFDPGAIDGIFGPRTEAAVIAFQRSVGLAATGVVDVLTWGALGVNCGIVPPPPPPPPPPGGRYVVQPGDTLSSIARRFNTTVQRILAVNPQITNPNVIFPGQVITIPAA